MSVSSEFADKLQAGYDQKLLIALMGEIDRAKRSIKSGLSQLLASFRNWDTIQFWSYYLAKK